MAKTYKEYEADIFKDTTPGVSGPADQTFTSTTEGGIPQTEASRIINKNRAWQKKYIADPLAAPFQTIGNIFTPKIGGENLFGKDNYWMMTPADREKRAVQMENLRLNRMKRDKIKDNILIQPQEGVKK